MKSLPLYWQETIARDRKESLAMIMKEVVNQAIDYILANIEEGITLEDVAGHCHLSK